MHTLKLCALLAALLAAVGVETAWARGGRFAAPPPAAGAPSSERPDAKGAPAAPAPDCPDPGHEREAPPIAPPPSAPDGGSSDAPGTRRRGARGPGLADWLYWYETNRERFEDLRTVTRVTEANPLFHLGKAHGPAVGRAFDALAPDDAQHLQATVLAVLDQPGHWPETIGAAYLALGKTADLTRHVERLLAGLDPKTSATPLVRESAALGLGHLRRREPGDRFAPRTLDRVRTRLLAVLDDASFQPRTRAFAAVSLGLLGDQPVAEPALLPERLTRTLAMRLIAPGTPEATRVGLVLGIELAAPQPAPSDVRAVLRRCMQDGRLGARDASSAVRAHATLALGRIGEAKDAEAVAHLLASRRTPAFALRHALPLAAASLARHEVARESLAKALHAAATSWREPSARGLAQIALAELVSTEAQAGGHRPFQAPHDAELLLSLTKQGTPANRAFAALALGTAVRDIDAAIDDEIWQRWRGAAIERLRAGAASKTASPHERAAFVLALGLARDTQSRLRMEALLRDTDAPDELRAYAALALGHAGVPERSTREALRAALEQDASELLRMRATTALGMLGTASAEARTKTLDQLVSELSTARSLMARGQVALTLGRMGDGRAVRALASLATDDSVAHETRAFAVAALGLIGERDVRTALARVREGANYLSGADVLTELLDIL